MTSSRLTIASATTATVGLVLAANILRKKRQGERRRGYVGVRAASGECRMLRMEERLEIRGLRNVGNSCFINAVLQSLASLQSFRNYLEVRLLLVAWCYTGLNIADVVPYVAKPLLAGGC